jgi:hypothetical protein
MIAERSLAHAAHAWGAHGIPFNDEPSLPDRDRSAGALLAKLGKAPTQRRTAILKLLEEAFGELPNDIAHGKLFDEATLPTARVEIGWEALHHSSGQPGLKRGHASDKSILKVGLWLDWWQVFPMAARTGLEPVHRP